MIFIVCGILFVVAAIGAIFITREINKDITDEFYDKAKDAVKCDICGQDYESYGADEYDDKPYCNKVIFLAGDKVMEDMELCPECMERLCHVILEWGEETQK